MLNIIIKHFFIYICCIYIYRHLQNNHTRNNFEIPISIVFSFSLALFTAIVKDFFPTFVNILPIIILWIAHSITSSQPKISFITTIIAFAISYGLFVFSSFSIVLFLAPLRFSISLDLPAYITLMSGVLEIILFLFLIRKKKFRQGMPFLYSKKFINIGTIICLVFFAILTHIQLAPMPLLFPYIPYSFLLVIALASLIFWWQAQLTKSYLRKLQLLELESLRKELEETSREMAHLKKQNEELGRLIHKDNKLIPAMETAVIDFLSASNQKENNALGQSLVSQLRELSGSRREILDEVSAARSHHFATGVPALDTLLTYFDRRAEARKMEFTVNVTPDLKAYVPSRISSDDITHLLADLLENAIIAVAPCTSRKIRLQIYPYRKWFVIELSDTGIPFQAKSLLQFGIQQLTTHKDSGGSGIGLMDVWKLKKKYHASIHITEYPDSFPFSKRITFLLDHRNQYLIRTWRCEELKAESRRTDLCILPPGNEISSSS